MHINAGLSIFYFSLMEAGGYIYYVIHILCIVIHEVLRMGVGSPVKHGVLPGHFDPGC